MSFFRQAGYLILLCIFLGITAGCSGSSTTAPLPDDEYPDNPRDVLSRFADACIAQDIDSACDYLLNPARWRHTMELASDALPVMGHSLKEAGEARRERDCYRFRMRLSLPDDPRHRVLENTVYVVRIRGIDGAVSRWGVDFTYPGDGQNRIRRQQAMMDGSAERSGQWGTMCTHASIMTRSIIAYYNAMYPDDSGFTGPRGYFNPRKYHFDTLATHPGPIETILFFDYDNYENMPPDAVLLDNAAIALVQAGSADEDVFVGEYNLDGSINYLRDIILTGGGTFTFQTTNDFGDDDDTFFKGFAHFLTPVSQDLYQTEFSEFDDAELFGGTAGAAVSAIDWALGSDSLGPYDILGILDMRGSLNRKTLPRAVGLIAQAKEEPSGYEAAQLIGNAFYTLGFTLHLLEDLSCPAHCRNDMHGVPIVSSIPGLGGLQPDPIEEWGETLTQSFLAETNNLYAGLIDENDPIIRGETGFPDDPILQNLYTNAEHPDYAGAEAIFKYTALIANRMCFSEDTIYTSTNYNAANTDNYPYLTSLDLDFFGKSVVYGTAGPPVIEGDYLAARGNAMFDVWRSWFWTTHWFTDPELEDVEEALRDGWDILTVADEDDEDYYAGSTLGVREQQWRLLYPLTVRTGAAYLHEFWLLTQE